MDYPPGTVIRDGLREFPASGLVSAGMLASAAPGRDHARMDPLRLVETTPGSYSLLLDAGTTPVDDLIEELGHEPNGYFWEGVARWLVTTDALALDGRFAYDPEAGMFCAHGPDRPALEELATRMGAIASHGDRMRQLIASAQAAGFEFDD
jgi:hypothetical protein